MLNCMHSYIIKNRKVFGKMPLVCLCVNWREGSRKAVLSVTRYHTETSITVTCCHLLTFTPLKAWQMLGRQSFSISINKLVSIINQTYPACQSLRSSKELTYQPTDGWIQRDLDLLAYYIRTGFCFLQIMPLHTDIPNVLYSEVSVE